MRTYVEREALNGGFPEPPPGGWVRVVRAEHDACGGETRVRLPGHVPTGAVRRVICQSCAQPFEAPVVEEVEVLEPPPLPRSLPALPDWLRDPGSRGWRVLSIALGAIAVIVALMAIRGSDEPGTPFDSAGGVPGAAGGAGARAAGKAAGAGGDAGHSADLVRESSFSLALPPGWQRTGASGGATFAAAAPGGEADATLWVERDPKLDVPSFEARSLDQLRSLAGSAHVVERVAAPTAEGTVARLAADAPEGSPSYEVTLRSSGPYRYYLSTTVQPDASRQAVDGAALIHGSFVPSGATGG